MKNKCIVIFIFLILNSGYIVGQRYPHGYTEYSFLNIDENKLDIYEGTNWQVFIKKLKLQWTKGGQKINIAHFGGSHIQADIWSNRMRQHFQNISPFNNSGRGMVFPFRIIGSNGSPYLKTSHIGKWKGYRNSVSSHTSPFGLLGARAVLLDSISKINFWVNKNHCTNCFYDQVDVFYNDSNNNYCIDILSDSIEWIKENTVSGISSFKLLHPLDSISISITKIDDSGSFELFGFRLQNQNTGFSYHSVGVNGASVPSYLKCEYLPKELGLVQPDLVIFSIGINDAYEPSFSSEIFSENYDSLIQIVKQINPNAAIILTTNNDSYYKRKYVNERALEVKEAMYAIAKKHDAVVWDFFEIMGGLDSILKWEELGLAKKDKIHLTPDGYKLVGDLFFEAILNSYKNYLQLDG